MQLTQTLTRTPTPTLISRFARLELKALGWRLARAFGIGQPLPIALEDLPIPDSKLAREATALVERCEPRFLVNHSIRTYLFGAAIERHLGLRFDAELAYLASILHDLALIAPYDTDGSFELNGARAARAFLIEQGADPARADVVHEAIALHSAVGIAHLREPEIAFVHIGAGLDVIGFHAQNVAAETREAIVAAHPRLDFKREFSKLIEDQATRKPGCHIAGHYGLGFNGKIAAAPFAE